MATSTADVPLNQQQDFGWALGLLVRNYQNASASVVEGFPHGVRGYQVLLAVASGQQPNQLALAQHLGIDRTVMTYLIDDFVDAGLVERQLNPADRRARLVIATGKGGRLLRELQASMVAAEQAALIALDQQEQAHFRELLLRVAHHQTEHDAGSLGACEAIETLLA